MNVRALAGNLLGLALLATSTGSFLMNQKDKAAMRPAAEGKITQYRVDYAMAKARARGRYMMVEFGSDWCEDCQALAKNLSAGIVHDYFRDHFDFVFVDIGHSDRNFEAAESLGVDLSHGIPAAVFFAPDGQRIGATNHGELEAARNYSPAQILEFLQQVTGHRCIINPAISPQG